MIREESAGTAEIRREDPAYQSGWEDGRFGSPEIFVTNANLAAWTEYLDRLEEFAPIIRKRLQTEAVFVAPLRSERRLRQRVEGAIAEHIKAQPAPVSSLLPSDIRYYRRRADEEPVTVVIECRCHVHGLPRTLEV